MQPASLGDHPGRQVDALDRQAQPGEVRGDLAGTAADVADRAQAGYLVGEAPQQRAVQGLVPQLVGEPGRVLLGDPVVAGRGRVAGQAGAQTATQSICT